MEQSLLCRKGHSLGSSAGRYCASCEFATDCPDRLASVATFRALEVMNRAYNEFTGSTSASYTYYSDRQPADKYFYTTEKINWKGKPRYCAGIYRYLKSKKQWKLIKQVGFAKKKRAIQWASDAYNRKA